MLCLGKLEGGGGIESLEGGLGFEVGVGVWGWMLQADLDEGGKEP